MPTLYYFLLSVVLVGVAGSPCGQQVTSPERRGFLHLNLARQASASGSSITNNTIFQPNFAQQELKSVMLKYQKALDYLSGVDLSPLSVIPFVENFPKFDDPGKISPLSINHTVSDILNVNTAAPLLPDLPVSKSEQYAALALTDFISNSQDIQYYGNLGFGTPPQLLSVEIDTGSADLWIPANCADCSENQFQPSKSSTYKNSKIKFSIAYGAGAASGRLAQDVVTVSNLVVKNQTIGVVNTESDDFADYPDSGILGAAFGSIATSGMPTFFENLMMQDQVAAPFFSTHLARNQPQGSEICFGCYDMGKALGPVTWIPVKSKTYWAIDMDGIKLNSTSSLHTNLTVAIDTGTTLIYLPDAIARSFYGLIPGAKTAPQYGDGFYVYPCASNLQLALSFLGYEYSIETADFNLGRTSSGSTHCVGGILSLGDGFPDDLAIIGDEFLKSWYTVFDYSSGARIGFAPSVNNQ